MNFELLFYYCPSFILSNLLIFFAKQDRLDLIKAEEYCGKAMSANPNDGNVISMYADLIWRNHKDASRAEHYHLQAAKASPDNRYKKWDDPAFSIN